jgi:glycosyltransferase involved in cell wall biosynthesis
MPIAQRIAFVAPRFAEGGTVGGAETLLKALAERCVKAGRQVDFLTTCATNHFTWENTVPPGEKKVGGLTVHFFPVNEDRDIAGFLRAQEAIDQRGRVSDEDERTWIANSVNSRALIEHLRKTGYDRIVLGPYLFGVTYFGSAVRPDRTLLVPCLHDEAFAHLRIMKEMFGRVRGCLFNTAPERELARRLYDFPDARSSVVGLGLDPFEADPRAFARRRGLTAPYLIYSGRRETLKGTPLLCEYLRVFRQRTERDLKLVFTGSGQIDAPEELRPHILDVGFVPENEKHEAMAGALCFVHPSVNESLGIVLLESWLAGTPALVHAKSEVLAEQCRRGGGGLWFRNYPEFEEELLLLAEDAGLRNRLAESGRRFVLAEYSWPAVERRLWSALDA